MIRSNQSRKVRELFDGNELEGKREYGTQAPAVGEVGKTLVMTSTPSEPQDLSINDLETFLHSL
jgi:hypothetical protein